MLTVYSNIQEVEVSEKKKHAQNKLNAAFDAYKRSR